MVYLYKSIVIDSDSNIFTKVLVRETRNANATNGILLDVSKCKTVSFQNSYCISGSLMYGTRLPAPHFHSISASDEAGSILDQNWTYLFLDCKSLMIFRFALFCSRSSLSSADVFFVFGAPSVLSANLQNNNINKTLIVTFVSTVQYIDKRLVKIHNNIERYHLSLFYRSNLTWQHNEQ
jgi:hypothetical protein